MIHLLTAPVHGPVNLTAPYPVTNEEFTKELGRALGRPAPWLIPGFALHIVLGEFAGEVLAGQRALPVKLHESGIRVQSSDAPRGPRRGNGLSLSLRRPPAGVDRCPVDRRSVRRKKPCPVATTIDTMAADRLGIRPG